MKTLRILLLLAVIVLLAVVVSDYVGTQRAGSVSGMEEPEAIPRNLDSKASRFTWSQSSSNERKVEIHADTFEQIRDTTLLRLGGVELLIYRSDEESYDRIVCESARFDGETLYSEGEVTVLLGLVPGPPGESDAKATTIRSTGVTFQSKTGIASTDRYTEYEFAGGVGHSVGSYYDSVHRYFRMDSDAFIEQQASEPGQPPLIIRAGELTYYELGQRVDLKNGASLDHGSQTMHAAEAIVHLDAGMIRRITATEARGAEQQVSRQVRFETPKMDAFYSPRQILEHITGSGPSVMTSETGTSVIRVAGNQIDLHYETREGADESVLRDTHVKDSAVIEARPAPGSNEEGRVRRISSPVLHLRMREDGENMELVETLARGRLELLALETGGSQDVLDADHIQMFYTAGNQMERLQAAGNVALERKPGKDDPAAELLQTTSARLEGKFDAASGEMRVLRQWEKFHFTRGGREGRAGEAEFELAANRVELKNQAEVWDANSRTSADRLTLDEETGDFSGHGQVSSVYQEKPAKKASAEAARNDAPSELFSAAEPVYATAERMVSNQRSGRIEYHGKARLWQGADRVEAEEIIIERPEKKLTAEKNVLSVIAEQGDAPAASNGKAGVSGKPMRRPTEVRADAMEYDETSRQVAYNGSVDLRRGALRVKSKTLDAWLAPPGESGSRLEKAIARGAVEVTETAAGGPPRKGFGDEARFHPTEDKVILAGEPARVVNARQDTTQGTELTYYLNDDRLLVLGNPQERTYSLRRKREP